MKEKNPKWWNDIKIAQIAFVPRNKIESHIRKGDACFLGKTKVRRCKKMEQVWAIYSSKNEFIIPSVYEAV